MTSPRNSKPLSAEQRQQIEADYTFKRVIELRSNPVRGNFDAAHLREINRRIFQDLPALGFDDVTPGEYRPAVPPGNDWIKSRSLETVAAPSNVAYSPMDKAAQARLDKVLKDTNPARLSKLKTAEFTQAIGTLYAEADYIHPFRDGNSRTLREFTRELAEASGYTLEWDRFNKSPAGRDILYIARDLSVNELALPHIRHVGTKRDVLLSMDQFGNNRALPDLLRDAIQPGRVVAFEQMGEQERPTPRHDLNKNQAVLHDEATKAMTANLQELKKNPALAERPAADLETLAYWRGILREDNKSQPKAAQDAALVRFDKMAEDPQFVKKLNQETQATMDDKTIDQVEQAQKQQKRDTHEQSL